MEAKDFEKTKREKFINILNFMIYKGPFIAILEGFMHHFEGKRGSGFQRALSPMLYFFICYLVKRYMNKGVAWVQEYAAFIINLAIMVTLIEQSIFLNPDQFQIIFV